MAQNKHSLNETLTAHPSTHRHSSSIASSASGQLTGGLGRRQSVYLGEGEAANSIMSANRGRYAEFLAKSLKLSVDMVQPGS